MPYFAADDGTRLFYEVVGDGRPLLLHLGAGCDCTLWREAGYLDALARERTCILFDHRGHGRSDHPEGAVANHLDRFVSDVVALLETLGIVRTAFWGYSSAITVGLRIAEEHPSRIESLVFSGAIAARTATADEIARRSASMAASYRASGWDWLIDGFEADEGPVPEWMKARIRATPVAPVVGWHEARPDWGWSAWDALPRVVAPALFLVGALEDPEDDMAVVAARMPNATRVRIPGKGHINGFLDHTFVLPRVEAFLGGTAPRGA